MRGMVQVAPTVTISLLTLVVVVAVPVRHSVQRHSTEGAVRVRAAAGAAVEAGVLDGDINIVHLTDVHSWLSGHLHEPRDEADYPDVLAFFQHIEAIAHAKVALFWRLTRE